MPIVTFQHAGATVEAEEGEWLYDVCERAKSGIPFACKAGACGTCAAEVLIGMETMEPPSAREVRTLKAHGLDPRVFRLPCLAEARGDLTFGKPAAVATGAADGSATVRAFEVEVESYRPLNATVCEVRFFVKKEDFSYRPGQYVIFHVPGNLQPGDLPVRRSYSISVPPSDRRHFEVCVRAVAGGRGSNFVHGLRPGTKAMVEGPFGHFVLDESSDRDILMIATGTGMAPVKAMMLHLLDTRSDRRVRLFFGVRHEADLFHTDLLRGLKAHYPSFEAHVCLSQPGSDGWPGRRGRVTDLVRELVDPRDAAHTTAYLCGGRSMIQSATELLLEKGLPEAEIRFENFY